MESKRKNVYITIFVITTIVAATLAVYFGLEYKKLKEDNLKQYLNVKESSTISDKDNNKEETEVKKIEKEVQLSQENIDKIAKVVVEDYLNLDSRIKSSPYSVYTEYLDYSNDQVKEKYDGKYFVTNIKYDDFVSRITKYMTKELFENGKIISFEKNENMSSFYNSYKDVYINLDGYVARYYDGASRESNCIDNFELKEKNDNELTYNVTYSTLGGVDEIKVFKQTKKIIKVKNINDNYVVSGVV